MVKWLLTTDEAIFLHQLTDESFSYHLGSHFTTNSEQGGCFVDAAAIGLANFQYTLN